MVNQRIERIGSIDLLRVLAISLVIIFHLLYNLLLDNSLRPIGFIGISLFFIISGFLLAKKYPDIKYLKIKWLLKRYLAIAPLYYIALIVMVILLGKQIYSGSLIKTLLLHFAFIDFISPETAYTIISPAWFLIPLVGLYLLYPYLNASLKKNPYIIILAFLVMIAVRIQDQTLTAYSFIAPLFFLGEFCFGIVIAQNKLKTLPLLIIPLLITFVDPIMYLPFLIFYLAIITDIKPSKKL